MILRNKKEPLEKKTALGNPEKITIGGRWKVENSPRIWVVVEKKLFLITHETQPFLATAWA
jgi:hypothetical protein